jgi:hypothetical protein
MKDFNIVQSLRLVNVLLEVAKLTAAPIGAEGCPMKNYARTCLEVGWQIFLLGDFMLAVSEGTGISEEALSRKLPVPAHFGLKLRLIMFNKGLSFLLGIE